MTSPQCGMILALSHTIVDSPPWGRSQQSSHFENQSVNSDPPPSGGHSDWAGQSHAPCPADTVAPTSSLGPTRVTEADAAQQLLQFIALFAAQSHTTTQGQQQKPSTGVKFFLAIAVAHVNGHNPPSLSLRCENRELEALGGVPSLPPETQVLSFFILFFIALPSFALLQESWLWCLSDTNWQS